VGRPWIFRELTGGGPPDIVERREIMLEHLEMLCLLYGEYKAAASMKKFISGYVRGIEGASSFRSRVYSAVTPQDLKRMIKALPDAWDYVMK
jgi:tRNA-dihydrouridine synthase B